MARCRETVTLTETMGSEGVTLVCDLEQDHLQSFHYDELHDHEWRQRMSLVRARIVHGLRTLSESKAS